MRLASGVFHQEANLVPARVFIGMRKRIGGIRVGSVSKIPGEAERLVVCIK